jgi:hypothetical protein
VIREIFGNPFRRNGPHAKVLTSTILGLASCAYQERVMPRGELDPICLGVLADALEEAGATAELVEHLRTPGLHWRGCWVVDRILGKE